MQIVELPVPTTLDEPAATDFVATVAVRNEVQNLICGQQAGVFSAEELLPNWTDPYAPKRLFAGCVDGRIVARGVCETAVNGSPDVALLQIEVLAKFRGMGIGTALLDAMIAAAREEGRTTLQAYAGAAEQSGQRLTAATGHGSVPVDDPGVRFLLRHGWTLEQVERGSRLPLPVADLDARVSAAQEASGPDYRVHTWVDRAPTHWVPDLAELGTGMGTDAPSAELEAEDVWTPERWIEEEERNEGSPRTLLVAAVEHVPSGRIVGFTELSAPAELDRAEPGRHHRRARSPRAPARHAAEGREPRAPPAAAAGASRGDHIQRRGEPAHARRQRGGRVRAVRLRGGVEEDAGALNSRGSTVPRRDPRFGVNDLGEFLSLSLAGRCCGSVG